MQPNNTRSILEFFLERNQESARELINLYHSNNQIRTTSFRIPHHPINQKLRISEQEFRFMMGCIMEKYKSENPNITFAVENPTKGKYKFSSKAKNETTAFTDMAFFNQNHRLILNIEFKAENVGPAIIEKDIEKLCKESVLGGWCHIFKELAPTYPQTTMKSLFGKFSKALAKHYQPNFTCPMSFHILILEKRTLLSRKGHPSDWEEFAKIHKQGDDEISKRWLKKHIFNLKYSQWAEDLPPKDYHTTINDWIIDKY